MWRMLAPLGSYRSTRIQVIAAAVAAVSCGRIAYDSTSHDGALGALDGVVLAQDGALRVAEDGSPPADAGSGVDGAACTDCPCMAPDVQVSATSAVGPSLAWGGDRWAIVIDTGSLQFRQLSAAGVPLGSEVAVTGPGASAAYPLLVSAGTELGVVWTGRTGRSDLDVYFARLDAAGATLGAAIPVAATTSTAFDPVVAWTGSDYGIFWADNRDANYEIYFARVSGAGAPVGAAVRVTSDPGSSGSPSAVWNGSSYALVWSDDRTGTSQIHFALLDASGAALGLPRQVMADGGLLAYSLVRDGDGYALAWNDGNAAGGISFVRLDATGAPAGVATRVPTAGGDASDAQLVATGLAAGSRYGLIWNEADGTGRYATVFARLDGSGVPLAVPLVVTPAGASSGQPTVAWSGFGFGLAWWDDRPPGGVFVHFRGECP